MTLEKIVTDADGVPCEFKGIEYNGKVQDYIFRGLEEVQYCLFTPIYYSDNGEKLYLQHLKELYRQQYREEKL